MDTAMTLEQEQKTYHRELENLLAHEGEFVVIYKDKIIGVFAAYEDALHAGYQEVGSEEAFLVKKISSSEQIHYCTRDLDL